ncbi:MAG: hypothetical protein INR69_18200 [Mucilaginibacter polytrichastri]|nr:hypothetical protein [Mucilaginibacter polytrichastri]
MKDLLRRLKLLDNITTSLPISKNEFVNRLKAITDEEKSGLMLDAFDIFSSSKNEFKGEVSLEAFKIKKRRKFFDTNSNFAVANGVFVENNGQLIIETEINAFKNIFIGAGIFLLIFYSFIIIILFGVSNTNAGFIGLPMILLHATFMFAIPYFILRRSVKRLKYDLEREFFFLTKTP